MIVQLF